MSHTRHAKLLKCYATLDILMIRSDLNFLSEVHNIHEKIF